MSLRTKQDQELVDYLKNRWDHLRASQHYVNGKLHDDEMKWCELVSAGKRTRADANRALHHAEHVISRTVRYVMLTAFCTFLEETSGEFARRAFPSDFEDRAAEKKGSLFAKYIQVLVDAGFDTKPIRDDIAKFNALVTLRNCVVHAWGKVSGARKPKDVEKAVAKVDSAGIYKDE